MNMISAIELKKLLNLAEKPRISLYLPTHPGGSAQDPIQLKHLIAEAEDKLVTKDMNEDALKKMLRPARNLLSDLDVWKNTADGLAVFLTPSEMRWYRLRTSFGPSVM